jgi:hypothetical protein
VARGACDGCHIQTRFIRNVRAAANHFRVTNSEREPLPFRARVFLCDISRYQRIEDGEIPRIFYCRSVRRRLAIEHGHNANSIRIPWHEHGKERFGTIGKFAQVMQ